MTYLRCGDFDFSLVFLFPAPTFAFWWSSIVLIWPCISLNSLNVNSSSRRGSGLNPSSTFPSRHPLLPNVYITNTVIEYIFTTHCPGSRINHSQTDKKRVWPLCTDFFQIFTGFSYRHTNGFFLAWMGFTWPLDFVKAHLAFLWKRCELDWVLSCMKLLLVGHRF